MPIALTMSAAGFYPRGGGQLEAWIEPATSPRVGPDRSRPAPPRAWDRRRRQPSRRHRPADARPGRPSPRSPRPLRRDRRWSSWSSPGQGAALSLTAEHDGRRSPPRSSAWASAASRRRRSPTRPSISCSPSRPSPMPRLTPTPPTRSSCRWPSPRAGANSPSARSPNTSAPTSRPSPPSSTARSPSRSLPKTANLGEWSSLSSVFLRWIAASCAHREISRRSSPCEPRARRDLDSRPFRKEEWPRSRKTTGVSAVP